MREAVGSVCPALRGSIHYGSKGCICDFSPVLEDVRLKVLSGFLCSYCMDALDKAGLAALSDEVKKVMGKEWLGDANEPKSVAGMLANLGVDLFVARGLVPTWRESIVKVLREDLFKEALKGLYVILATGALFYLGWKAGR